MPSPLVHVTAGYVAYCLFRRRNDLPVSRPDVPLLATTLFFSTLPDVDIVLGFWHRDMGNFHNQESHSLFMGLFVSLLFAAFFLLRCYSNAWRMFGIALSCYTAHVILDSLIPSRGVMMFWPFTMERFASPVPIFFGLHWSEGIWSPLHILTFGNELLVSALAVFAAHLWLRSRQPPASPDRSSLSDRNPQNSF
jgi:inner membrane protein